MLDLQANARLVVCDVVYAEVSGVYRAEGELRSALFLLGLEYDFLVGAHALIQANGLLAADRGYLRRYFAGLKLLEPRS